MHTDTSLSPGPKRWGKITTTRIQTELIFAKILLIFLQTEPRCSLIFAHLVSGSWNEWNVEQFKNSSWKTNASVHSTSRFVPRPEGRLSFQKISQILLVPSATRFKMSFRQSKETEHLGTRLKTCKKRLFSWFLTLSSLVSKRSVCWATHHSLQFALLC